MGANSAVQDANNLAWKLGAVRAGLDDDIDDLVLILGQRHRSAAILGEVPSAPFGRPVADQPEPGARMPTRR